MSREEPLPPAEEEWNKLLQEEDQWRKREDAELIRQEIAERVKRGE